MREKLLWGGLAFLGLYMIIPWIISRVFGWGVHRRGKQSRQAALTFDDGPDPNYTPKLLDLLQLYNIKATFFVLGSKAEQHPELIQRIHREGHQIGVHNYTHMSNWLMTPGKVRKRHVDHSADIVERITGVRPSFYRPPWGILNLGDFLLKRQYSIVMWSLMAGDWNVKTVKKRLRKLLLTRVTDGSVILLHDSGKTLGADPEAPHYMLEALGETLAQWDRSFEFVRIDQMFPAPERKPSSPATEIGWVRRFLLSCWLLWERCFVRLFHITPVSEEDSLFQLRCREYYGNQPIQLSDGVVISKGDRIAELHFNNDLLFQLSSQSKSSVQLAIQMIRRTEAMLPKIVHLLQTDPMYKDVKGLYGISLIHRGTSQLGFTVIDLPKGVFSFATQYYLKLMMYILHPQGKQRLKTKRELLVPKIIAISTRELQNRYIA
ncbi:polysaccharide deacetylase family protein [Paenibacillus sp. J2TS4]|uniref:polysaccharide deacetylase family protein n=1 Tax=Paenibacillus sp. J2TS4 TaxID=2807194 RepID=UPI001B268240|nr:polysaccharide deacetylase family protein [Paenibacillus sp. J2TS4]GIP34044.1 hypothetical protein J2TS4_32540 [Paenibacillus sp. J2TS4]